MSHKLRKQLKDIGSKLQSLPASKDSLVKLLKDTTTCLSDLEQSPSAAMLEAMQPLFDGIVKQELLKHSDRDVRLLVATCICEVTRITAPEAPYSDDILKDIFSLIVGTINGLNDTTGPSFGRRVVILETLARYRSCVVMLDLECYDLINQMFSAFFAVVRDNHPEDVITSMQTIMVVLLEESEEIPEDLLLILLSPLGRNRKDVNGAARMLAMNVIEQCAEKLEPDVKQFLVSSISGDDRSLDSNVDYHEVIFDIYRCAPQVLAGVAPYLTGELLTDQVEIRLKAVKLVGDLFALPGSSISEAFQPVFTEFLKRLTDRVVDVRISVLEDIKSCLLSDPSRVEATQILSALCDRLLDYDENVRKEVVSVVCDVEFHALNSIPVETLKLVAERIRDKSLLVKKYTMERLADIYRLYCLRCTDSSIDSDNYDWIPGKILRCFYDKDFQSDTIESFLFWSMFPSEFSTKDKVKHWVKIFSKFDRVEVKALEKMLEQKQRLQQEMLRYLSLRQMSQNGDEPEREKKVFYCFRVMSRWFRDPMKAEEDFLILDQLTDANIWKILANLLDSSTGFSQTSAYRDELLKILGEKHRLYDFLSILSVKCSHLFDKEYVKQFLVEASEQKKTGNDSYISSCMSIIAVIARFCPFLLTGTEEELVNLLKDDNEIIKEGILHVLAKAGGTIREQLAALSSSVDLLLERLCIEGTRRQAKYAVHALATITKDDGLKSLSVLYKRLVDMLEERTYLPAVLQSLGCIAQTAMPVFETRESEIEEFIQMKLLQCSQTVEDSMETCWDKRSDLCSLKIFGINTLVKSYLPVKDAHLRPGIDGLLMILKNILLYGDVSKDIESSSVDKAHLRLASAKAILRLSRCWDHKIPVDVFHLTLRTSEISFPQARKMYLGKVNQYIKDRLLDAKYACSFLVSTVELPTPEFEEIKHNLGDIIQMCHQLKAKQPSSQSDVNSPTAYPEYILPYLVHALAHIATPDVDECKDVKTFEPVYRQLFLFLSLLVFGDDGGKSEGGNIKETERINCISSIFGCIARAEDVVDVEKSKNSYALCDLGISIIKRLAQKEDLPESTANVSLPTVLYKPYEAKEEDEINTGRGHTWLADGSALAHLESIKLHTDETVTTEIFEKGLPGSDVDGNEMPLGKIVKDLKSRGAKGKKVMKKSLPDKVKPTEKDVDILKMVREINVDALGKSSKFGASNGHGLLSIGEKKSNKSQEKKKRTNVTDAASVPVPKRPRSIPSYGAATKSSLSKNKGIVKSSKSNLHQSETIHTDTEQQSDSEERTPKRKSGVKHSKSDNLVSTLRKHTESLKQKGKKKDRGSNGQHQEDSEASNHAKKKPKVSVESEEETSGREKSALGSFKKQKRRSVAGLAKCTSKNDGSEPSDIVGCRIKVWWPMDKQFYKGTVKSYDAEEKKHEVLYDDGDVELLVLEKERWELVDSSKSAKKDSSKKLPSGRESLERKIPKSPQPSKKSKISSSTKVKGKRTQKRNAGQRQSLGDNLFKPEARESSDISDPEPVTTSKNEDIDADHLENDLVSQGVAEEKIAAVSEGKELSDAKETSEKESDNVDKIDPHEGETEDADSIPKDSQGFDENGKGAIEENQAGETCGVSGDEVKIEETPVPVADDEPSDSESNPASPAKSEKDTSDADSRPDDADNSEDEPLSLWKQRVVKKPKRE